ncbi:hypothetical protein [Parvularcula marina]|uniref:Uncharacterized protein n=1 Tax=Parvularcula marina TaxID=2292771 RepID=A0A371RFU3_9PROT|nr:hypothetical protein [Parvularcula marina]RFB04323.1 hypothetical protein DX908_02905 [Parvularcula marina]
MSAIGTLILTAAATAGAVTLARKVKRRIEAARNFANKANGDEPILDLEVDEASGVWRVSGGQRV